MKASFCLAAAAVVFGAALASADEVKSGLAAGEKIGAFQVVKLRRR